MSRKMSKKKPDTALVCSMKSEEEWNEMMDREGILTVVDVYSEWAGPCNAMANYLKKIKLEVGDELLQCAMAKCDTIDALKMFRGHCKPIWLFIIAGQTVQVMHGSNAPLLGRIINEQMVKLKSGDPVVDSISLDDAVPESELHLDLALEEQERLSKEMSKKMENKKLFDESEFAIIYLQEYIHSTEESVKKIEDMVQSAGLKIVSVCEAKLEEEEPRILLKDTGFEDQCAKLNGHPAKMMLLRGEHSEETARKALGEGDGSLKEEFRNESEPGCLLVCGSSQMLPLAKKYFYSSFDEVILGNEVKWATKCLVIFALESAEEIAEKMDEIKLELMEKEELTLTEEQVQALVPEGKGEEELEELKGQLLKPVLVYAFRNLEGDIDEGMFKDFGETEVQALLTTKKDDAVWKLFPNFGEKKPEETPEGEEATEEVEK